MRASADLLTAITGQAAACAAFGSPFSEALLTRAAQDVAAGGPCAALFAPWAAAEARAIFAAAAPLRLLGALHDRVLSREDPALAAAYPASGRPGDPDAAWKAALTAIAADEEGFQRFMAHEPQTNEVRRCAALAPGFLTAAEAVRLPLRIFELGASAGLNTHWDRFHYDFGGVAAWGPAEARVRIDPEWIGPPPPTRAPVRVISRAACDRAPIDLHDPIARRRLKAFVWADQFDRLKRLDGAIETALAEETRVEAEDAVTWTARRAAPAPGALTIVYHSVFWQYLPDASQAALAGVIEAHGAAASALAPFGWLRMEPSAEVMITHKLSLTLWPGAETRILAQVHPHGAKVEWTG
jgi:hypothetical protein